MIIDVHTHIFPEKVITNRQKYYNEPAFFLLYGHPKAKMARGEEIISAMDEAGIDRSVVFGFPWSSHETTMMHNDYVLEWAGKYPHRLIPLACVLPTEDWAVREVERCLKSGSKGVGEIAIYGACDSQRVLEIYSQIAELVKSYNGVMLVHANEPIGHSYPGKAPQGLDFYYEIVKRAQNIPLILAHWAGGLFFYALLKREVPELFRSLFVDTAASPFLYTPKIYRVAIEILGVEKILFGSDYPLLELERYRKEMRAAGLSEEEQNMIEGGNAAKILGML
ncbi:MAG: amidohydrolase family protein [Syntrophobacterales bacterium]|nr:amidohydrolase family protein [Syntrophobacterales bacterium]